MKREMTIRSAQRFQIYVFCVNVERWAQAAVRIVKVDLNSLVPCEKCQVFDCASIFQIATGMIAEARQLRSTYAGKLWNLIFDLFSWSLDSFFFVYCITFDVVQNLFWCDLWFILDRDRWESKMILFRTHLSRPSEIKASLSSRSDIKCTYVNFSIPKRLFTGIFIQRCAYLKYSSNFYYCCSILVTWPCGTQRIEITLTLK